MTPTPTTEQEAGRILLVDDNPTNLQVLYETLQGRGYELRIAKNGEDALALAEKVRPHLILLDIMMPPGIDGYETLARLKAQPEIADTAVIFLSALDDTKDKVKGLDLGAVDYVSKPFQADEVIARVNTHLTMHRLQADLAVRNAALEAANEKMKNDLEAAARVQQALLPSALPATDTARFAWEYRPCDELAGDCLNLFGLGSRYISLYVLDVSGHGVSAALLSVAVTRTLSETHDRSAVVVDPEAEGLSIVAPSEVARRLNALYPMAKNGSRYFTMVYGVLDTETLEFRYVCAGHSGPILVRSGQAPQILDKPNLPVGIMPVVEFEEASVTLQKGDRLFLYSDGMYEERNEDAEEFGRPRLAQTFQEGASGNLQENMNAALQAVIDWRGDDNFVDDVSLLALEIRA